MEENVISECERLCDKILGQAIDEIKALPASGSSRRYFRVMFQNRSYIICYSENVKENNTFITLTEYFKERRISVPAILGVSDDLKCYMLQDLGSTDFMSLIHRDQFEGLEPTLGMIFHELVNFQTLPKNEWIRLVEFSPLDTDLIRYDFNYCKENFLEPLGLNQELKLLDAEFEKLENILISYPQELWGLMYRDFQSRNIMICNDKPYFIDYQSSRYGPGIYDLVSFSWQAKAGFSMKERQKIINCYCDVLESKEIKARTVINDNIGYWAIFRIIQTLGAYGLRGLKEGKKHFIESIPFAVDNLLELLETYDLHAEFPRLSAVIREIRPRFSERNIQ